MVTLASLISLLFTVKIVPSLNLRLDTAPSIPSPITVALRFVTLVDPAVLVKVTVAVLSAPVE